MRVFQDQRSYLKLCQPSMYDNYTGPFNYYNIPIYVFKSINCCFFFGVMGGGRRIIIIVDLMDVSNHCVSMSYI